VDPKVKLLIKIISPSKRISYAVQSIYVGLTIEAISAYILHFRA